MKKRLVFLLLYGIIIAGCSPESPERDKINWGQNDESNKEDEDITENDDKNQTVDITDELCDGFRFVEREYEEKSTPLLGVYKTVTIQNEYFFLEEGKGSMITYVAENTPRGYSQKITDFTWSATNKKPVTLKILLEDGETIKLENVEITDEELSFTSGLWTKEIIVENAWSSPYVERYTVDFSYYDSTESQPPYLVCLNLSPARLTVTTSIGKVTFITYPYGVNPTSIAMSAYSKDGSNLNYYDSYLYACVDTHRTYSPCSFFEIVSYTTEKPFTENGKMYFYIGKFIGEKKKFIMIESNESNVPSN